MIKRSILGVLSVWIIFIIQSSVFSRINIGDVIPNLLIILTATWGFMYGEKSGLVVGFSCGLLMDIFCGSFLGLYALIFMYIGYLNGKFCNMFFPEDIKLPLVLITVSDFLYGFSCYVFLYLLRGRFNFSFYLVHVIIPEIIATLIFTFVLYPLTLLIHKKVLTEMK